jgi:N-acyl-D-aspartate/D-glutamate deacylase
LDDTHFEVLKSLITASEANLSNQLSSLQRTVDRDRSDTAKRLDDHEDRLQTLEAKDNRDDGANRTKRGVWNFVYLVIGAVATMIAGLWSGLFNHFR